MKKHEPYERKIAELEEEVDRLRSSLSDAVNRHNIKTAKLLAMRESFYKGVTKFLSDLYAELGNVQQGVLGQLAAVNGELIDINKKRSRVAIAELQNSLKLVGYELSEKTDDDEDNI